MSNNDNRVPTIFGIPMNRLVAFAGPHLSWLAGVAATWLTVHVHLFSTFHVGNSDLAKAFAQAAVFGVVTLVTWLGQHKWLDGFQKWAYSVYTDISHTEVPEGTYDPNEFGPQPPTSPPGIGGS